MTKTLIILLAVLIILIAIGIGIYYFVSYNYSIGGSITNLTNGNQNSKKPAPKVEKETFLAVDDLEFIEQDYPEVIEGTIKVSDGQIIKNKLGDTIEHTLYAVSVASDGKEYLVVEFDESDYDSVGIKDGQKVKVYGLFLDKSKNLLLAGAVIPE